MTRKPLAFIAAVVFALVGASTQVSAEEAVGPIDSAVAAYQAEFQAARDAGQWPSGEQRGAMVDEALADIDPASLSVEDTAKVFNAMPVVFGGKAQAFDAALAEHAKQPTFAGARAADMRFMLLNRETAPEVRADMVRNLFKHPGAPLAWEQGKALNAFSSFYALSPEHVIGLEPDFIALQPMINDQLPAAFFIRVAGTFMSLASAGDDASAAAREPLRQHLVTTIQQKLASQELEEAEVSQLQSTRDRLDGAFARGQLVGHTAPELNFTWWSNPNDADESIAKLSDLKGKVVVLDFWATWCGPCIGSFPNVKELQSHYDGYDVVIVGVTAIQGAHYSGDERGKIDCTDDPEKEMALMPEFMEAKDVTWRIAFAQEPVFNPDYGVNGIPHVAIVDPQGVVRFRGLHPAMPMEAKTSKIDELLAEAGKPVPPAPESATPEDAAASAEGN